MEKIAEIDGRALYYAFLAGSSKIMDKQKVMNDINVFPVPDGDTGSNLATTVTHILEHSSPNRSVKETADAMAAAALDGARGNSGMIFAQFLHGFSQKLGSEGRIDVSRFSQILKGALQYAVEAIERPVEGTIITVLRDWFAHVDRIKGRFDDFIQVIKDSLVVARRSLRDTPKKLEVLRLNRVVDAGAQGFVYFLEGIWEALRDSNPRRVLSWRRTRVEPARDTHRMEDLNYRYCTEGVIEGDALDTGAIRARLREMGDSLVVAGSNTKMRIHIHTDRPEEVFWFLKNQGTVSQPKVDDMRRQYETIHDRKHGIALVTDSVCDLPAELVDRYQIHRVPIHIHFGPNHFLDKSTITPVQFYGMLDSSPDYPTTSQPGMNELLSLYRRLADHYDSVLAIHMSRKLSGTWNASRKAADQVASETGKTLSVIDSRQLSGSLGLVVLRAAEAIDAGRSHGDILAEVERWCENALILVSVKTLKYMVKGGRVSPMKGKLANVLNLKPIVSLNAEGDSILYDKAFSQKGSMKRILALLERHIRGKRIWKFSVMHAHDPEAARWFSERLSENLDCRPEYIIDISPAVGVSAGYGATAVALMTE